MQYYVCVDGEVGAIEECAEGLSFDPIDLQCVREEISTCVDPTPEPTLPDITTELPTTEEEDETTTTELIEPEEPTTTAAPPLICESPGVYNLPIPGGDCTQYYLCANFEAHIQVNPARTINTT